MAEPTPNLYCKMESEANIINPEIGAGGGVSPAPNPPSFIPGYDGNGLYCNANDEYARFPTHANGIEAELGTVTFYLKMQMLTEVLGRVIFSFYDAAGEGLHVQLVNIAGSSFLRVNVFEVGVIKFFVDAPFSWNIGDVYFIRILWDYQGTHIGEGRTISIYRQTIIPEPPEEERVEILVGSSGTTWNIIAGCLAFCYFGNHSGLVKNRPLTFAVIDEVRAYDTIVLPPPPPPPITMMPMDLLCEQKKNPIDVTDPNPEFSAIHHVEGG